MLEGIDLVMMQKCVGSTGRIVGVAKGILVEEIERKYIEVATG